jgi:hypothetical protein
MSRRLIVVGIFVLALATVAVAADDPFVGTWRLSIEKSKSSAQIAWPKSSTIKIAAQINGLKISQDRIFVDGKMDHADFAEIFDGKDYPSKSKLGMTMAYTRVNSNTILVLLCHKIVDPVLGL